MIRVLSVTPVYEADGTLLSYNIPVEIVLSDGTIVQGATVELEAKELDLALVENAVLAKLKNGLGVTDSDNA